MDTFELSANLDTGSIWIAPSTYRIVLITGNTSRATHQNCFYSSIRLYITNRAWSGFAFCHECAEDRAKFNTGATALWIKNKKLEIGCVRCSFTYHESTAELYTKHRGGYAGIEGGCINGGGGGIFYRFRPRTMMIDVYYRRRG